MEKKGKMEKLRPDIYFASAYIHVKLCCELPNNPHTYGLAYDVGVDIEKFIWGNFLNFLNSSKDVYVVMLPDYKMDLNIKSI